MVYPYWPAGGVVLSWLTSLTPASAQVTGHILVDTHMTQAHPYQVTYSVAVTRSCDNGTFHYTVTGPTEVGSHNNDRMAALFLY